ncbi:MAG: peptidyl-prolyl cis-trans isomerase [Alphaproteobacteria bacterium]|nr:peptidyl-prolyl cis-trans isomerase [Alphaproteobacteria bacterium]
MISRKFAALAMVSFIALGTAEANAEGNKGVAAVVNGKDIMVTEIRDVYEAMPEAKEKVTFDDFYEQTIRDFVGNELVYQAAESEKVTETPEYEKNVKAAKREIASKLFLKNKVDALLTDEQLKKVYEEYKKNFVSEKEISARHILVSDEDKAKEVITKLDNGGDFNKLAKEYSREPAELGYFGKQTMVPEFSDAAFKLKIGEYTKEPVKTQFGYHVIIVDDSRDSKPQEFDKVKMQLKAAVARAALDRVLQNISNQAKVTMYDLDGKIIPDTPAASITPEK